MNTDEVTLDTLIDANTLWLGLKIEPEWRLAIQQSLVALATAIDAIDSFPLPDEAEPANKFEP